MGKGKRKSIAKRNKAAREYKHMTAIYASYGCGCCEAKMWFESESSAVKAFNKAGLDCGANIVDDAGAIHEGIDTFYGFSLSEETMHKRGLGYLMNKLN